MWKSFIWCVQFWINGITEEGARVCVCVCVHTHVLWQMALKVRDRGDRVKGLLHEPGPHVAARGESLLPDLHLFLEPSYIGMIANVQLISFKHGQTNLDIHNIEHRQHGDAKTEQGKKKKIGSIFYAFHLAWCTCSRRCFYVIQWWTRNNHNQATHTHQIPQV